MWYWEYSQQRLLSYNYRLPKHEFMAEDMGIGLRSKYISAFSTYSLFKSSTAIPDMGSKETNHIQKIFHLWKDWQVGPKWHEKWVYDVAIIIKQNNFCWAIQFGNLCMPGSTARSFIYFLLPLDTFITCVFELCKFHHFPFPQMRRPF